MYKIFAPRGGGRTYQICKYAIENDCDIIVPTFINVELVTKTIIFLCESSCGKWIYRGYREDIELIREKSMLILRENE